MGAEQGRARGMTPAIHHPLNSALPADMAPSGASISAFYRRFPVYSWPWIWRRFFVLAPLAIIPALMVGLNYGALVGDSDRAIAIASRLAAAYLVALLAGPLLAIARSEERRVGKECRSKCR